MGQPSLIVMGLDCSAYVSTWGKLAVVKKLKLSDSSLFASAFSISVDNTKGTFTAGGKASIFPRVGWAGQPVSIVRDGRSLYDGYLNDLDANDDSDIATLHLVSSLSTMGDTIADLTKSGVNPAIGCLGLIQQAGLGDFVDGPSFSVAAGLLAPHIINIVCPASEGQTCLSLASTIADICSLDFVLTRGRIYCQAQRPWDGTGLRQEINGSNAHDFGTLGSDATSFANRVLFAWGGSGAVSQKDDLASQRAEGGKPVSTTVDATTSSKVQVSRQASADYFAGLLLSRTSPRHGLLPATLGPDFDEILPGWRFPVNYESLALKSRAFEVNESQLDLDTDEYNVTLQTLEQA